MSEECEFCNWPEGAYRGCRAEQNPGSAGYECSREEGHPGPHVACGVNHHALATWVGVFDYQEIELEDEGSVLSALVELSREDGHLIRATFTLGDDDGGQVLTILDRADLLALASLASEAALLVGG